MSAICEVNGHKGIGCDVATEVHLEIAGRVDGCLGVKDKFDALIVAVVIDLVELEEYGDSGMRR